MHWYTAIVAASAIAAATLGDAPVGRELGGIALLTREVMRYA
jgi:hypothetical protein